MCQVYVKSILISCLTFCTSLSYAQIKITGGHFIEGYIVTTDNDTVKGFVALFDEVTSAKEVHFKKSKTTNKMVYYPENIRAYGRKGEVYRSYKDIYCLLKSCGKNKYQSVFIKLVEKDVLTIFMFAANHNVTQYYAVNYIPLLQKSGFDPIPYKNNIHIRKQVSAYFTDYPELATKLRNKEYKSDDFDEVVTTYTRWSKSLDN
ncbi:MAG: hypothetical protein AAGI07_16015 [Bacteroidota bacterium]